MIERRQTTLECPLRIATLMLGCHHTHNEVSDKDTDAS